MPTRLQRAVSPARTFRNEMRRDTDGTANGAGERATITIHRDHDRLLFEVPPRLLDRDIALIERVAEVHGRASTPASGGGLTRGTLLGSKVFRWTDGGADVRLQWRASDGYIEGNRYPVVRRSIGGGLVIDVTSAYVRTEALSALRGAGTHEAPLHATLQAAHAFADHVELDVEYRLADRTITVHRSLLALPATPMMPRFADDRVGFFSVPAPTDTSAATTPTRGLPTDYVRRFRLEKRDPSAAVSDVVKPIVFYVDPMTPARWVPWIIRGVDAWQPVFETMGFRNAIMAKAAPTRAQDPNWSLYDASHSSITWVAEAEENASGEAAELDDKTGELVSGRVTLYGGLESLMQRVGFALLGGVSDIPLPFPDSIMGELLAMVTTHEVGHVLGLAHNFKAASTYPTDSAHNAAFVHRRGYSPSLMDYAYFNFLAQPDDHLPFAERHGRLGPYDAFAIGWGYRPIPAAKTPADELPTLEEWRRAQDSATYLRTSRATGIDPGDQPDDIGDNLVESAELATRNFARVGARLVGMQQALQSGKGAAASTGSDQRWTPPFDLDMIAAYQNEVLHRWSLVMMQAAGVVGGAVPKAPYTRDPEAQQLVPFDSAYQVAAMRLVLDHALRGKDELVQTQFGTATAPIRDLATVVGLTTLPNGWDIDQWHQKQIMVVGQLLNDERLGRVAAQSAGTLRALCDELDSAHRELARVADVSSIAPIPEQIDGIVGSGGVCRQHGWTPHP